MNKGKARRRAIQAERKKQKKDGTFISKPKLYAYQREVIERIIYMRPLVYFKPTPPVRQGKIRCKVEVFEE